MGWGIREEDAERGVENVLAIFASVFWEMASSGKKGGTNGYYITASKEKEGLVCAKCVGGVVSHIV